MTRRSRARASSLFLIELILAIFFFSSASAVCVQFFVKSHLLNRSAEALNHAVNECTNITETISTADSATDSITLLQKLYPSGMYPIADSDTFNASETLSGMDIFFYYNDAFAPCQETDAVYLLSLKLSQTGQMLHAAMEVTKTGHDSSSIELIYEMEANHHIARRTGYEKR